MLPAVRGILPANHACAFAQSKMSISHCALSESRPAKMPDGAGKIPALSQNSAIDIEIGGSAAPSGDAN